MNLEKVKKFANSWGLLILMILVLFKTCGTASKAKSATEATEKTSEVIDSALVSLSDRVQHLEDKVIDKKEAKDIMEKVMLDFLIYENEIDKKQITISQIKDKIKENE